jgi:hypothetical protein
MPAAQHPRDDFDPGAEERDFDATNPDLVGESLEELLFEAEEAPPPGIAPKLAEAETRFQGPDRRKNVVGQNPTGLERRRGPGRRLTDYVKSAEEGEMNSEQFLFLRAVEAFKAVNNRHYPTWTDVLEVVRLLGYRKVQPSELNLPAATDWTEKPDSASNVRQRDGVLHKRKPAA